MKLTGFVDPKKLDLVIDEYIIMNQRKLVRPYLNMRDNKNKAVYDMDGAKKMVKKRLLETYT
jgi:hypothetical protein